MSHPLRLGIVGLGLLICLIAFQKLGPIVNPAANAQVVPTGIILATPMPRNVVVLPAPVNAPPPTQVIAVYEQPTSPMPLTCELATWPDGSQSCSDGIAIDAEHSQPGYCVVIQWDNGQLGCNDGKPAGIVVATAIPEQLRPAPDPVGAQGDYTVSSDQRCVTAINPAGDAETRCADEPMSQATIDWLARAIEDGRAPGTGVPKG